MGREDGATKPSLLAGIRSIRRAVRGSRNSCAGSSVGQIVGLGVASSGHVADGKIKRTGQLAADPMQGIKTRTAAGVFASHLPHDHLGVRVDMEHLGPERESVLQRFQQGHVLGDIVVLMPNPLGDFNLAGRRAMDDHSNTRRPWVTQRTDHPAYFGLAKV